MLVSQLYKSDPYRYISDKFSEKHDYVPEVYDKYFLSIKETAKTITAHKRAKKKKYKRPNIQPN